jgi:hypothetical protein
MEFAGIWGHYFAIGNQPCKAVTLQEIQAETQKNQIFKPLQTLSIGKMVR